MKRNHKCIVCAFVVLLLPLGAPALEAQGTAGSFERLASRATVGNRVIVKDLKGGETHGTILELSPSSLGLDVEGTRADFPAAEIESVSRRDSRWSGTLWGLAIGTAFGIWTEHGLAEEYGRDDVGRGSVILPFAGLGAGIGFVVDAAIRGRRVIYMRERTSTKRATVAAAWDAHQKAVFVSMRF